jgi:hypothetical protein
LGGDLREEGATLLKEKKKKERNRYSNILIDRIHLSITTGMVNAIFWNSNNKAELRSNWKNYSYMKTEVTIW